MGDLIKIDFCTEEEFIENIIANFEDMIVDLHVGDVPQRRLERTVNGYTYEVFRAGEGEDNIYICSLSVNQILISGLLTDDEFLMLIEKLVEVVE